MFYLIRCGKNEAPPEKALSAVRRWDVFLSVVLTESFWLCPFTETFNTCKFFCMIDLSGFRQTTSYYPRVRPIFRLAEGNFMLYKTKTL